MAATNVQAFSGDVEVASNFAVNTNDLFVDTVSGRVGIGTTNPSSQLELYGSGKDLTFKYDVGISRQSEEDRDAYYSGIENSIKRVGDRDILGGSLFAPDTTHEILMGFSDTYTQYSGLDEYYPSYNEMRFKLWSPTNLVSGSLADIMTLRGNGTVGIGTTNPSDSLHVMGAISTQNGGDPAVLPQVLFRSGPLNTNSWEMKVNISDAYAGDFSIDRLDASTPAKFVIKNNGNVGIGTTNPRFTTHITHSSSDDINYGLNIQNSYSSGSSNRMNLILFSDSNSTQAAMGGYRVGYTSHYLGGLVFYVGNQPSGYVQSHPTGASDATASLTEAMRIKENGNVGIGTTNPIPKFAVYGSGITSFSANSYYLKGSITPQGTAASNWGVSIYGNSDIVAGQAIASNQGALTASDIRIKKNIVDADDSECLEVLRLLKPKKYQYKDEFKRGQEPVWGFIAQEVRETLPYASQLRQEFLPNIYELANVSDSNVITFTNFNTSNLESNATTLIRTVGIDGEDRDIHLAEVIDEHTIRVEEDLTEWIGSVDETGNVVAGGNQLFICGQQVDDFVFLKKEAIWTVATSALQEVDRQLQAEKAKVATLETQLTSVLARLDALEGA